MVTPEVPINQPELSKRNPTKASRGFLGRMVHGAREVGIVTAYGLTPGGGLGLALRNYVKQLPDTKTASVETPVPVASPNLAELRTNPAVSEQTPTEASESFTQRWKDRLNKKVFFKILIPIAGGLGVSKALGEGVMSNADGSGIARDIGEGNYNAAAVRGVIAAGTVATALVVGFKLSRSQHGNE